MTNFININARNINSLIIKDSYTRKFHYHFNELFDGISRLKGEQQPIILACLKSLIDEYQDNSDVVMPSNTVRAQYSREELDLFDAVMKPLTSLITNANIKGNAKNKLLTLARLYAGVFRIDAREIDKQSFFHLRETALKLVTSGIVNIFESTVTEVADRTKVKKREAVNILAHDELRAMAEAKSKFKEQTQWYVKNAKTVDQQAMLLEKRAQEKAQKEATEKLAAATRRGEETLRRMHAEEKTKADKHAKPAKESLDQLDRCLVNYNKRVDEIEAELKEIVGNSTVVSLQDCKFASERNIIADYRNELRDALDIAAVDVTKGKIDDLNEKLGEDIHEKKNSIKDTVEQVLGQHKKTKTKDLTETIAGNAVRKNELRGEIETLKATIGKQLRDFDKKLARIAIKRIDDILCQDKLFCADFEKIKA